MNPYPPPGAFFLANGKRGDVWGRYVERSGIFLVSSGFDFTEILGRASSLADAYQIARAWLSEAP